MLLLLILYYTPTNPLPILYRSSTNPLIILYLTMHGRPLG